MGSNDKLPVLERISLIITIPLSSALVFAR
jgi:hypothetical protein